jgi:hypothetical protein
MSVRRGLYFIAALIPAFYIVYLISCYGVDIPYWDQWELVPLLGKMHAGKLSLADLWVQHNEHRVLFPKMIMLLLAFLTDWDIICELYVNVALGCLIFLFTIMLLRLSGLSRPSGEPYWLPIVFSLLIFSPVQFENWLWGWQIQMFLNVLAGVAAVWSLARWPGQWKGIILSTPCAIVSSYSFNNGLLIWLAASVMFAQKGWKGKYIAVWFTAFLMTAAFYYYGYEKPSHHPSLQVFIHHPYDFIRYVLAYIGAPLGCLSFGLKTDIAICIALVATIMLVSSAIFVYRSSKEDFSKLLPWMALAAYAFLSALATGVGRVGLGAEQALAPRYTTFSTLFIISSIAVFVSGIGLYKRTCGQLPEKGVIALSSLSTLLILSFVLSFSYGRNEMIHWRNPLRSAAPCLKNADTASEECLRKFYPNPEIVRERVKILSSQKLSLFRNMFDKIIKGTPNGMSESRSTICDGFIDVVNGISPAPASLTISNTLSVVGWMAISAKDGVVPDAVFVTLSDENGIKIYIKARRTPRPDVNKAYKQPRMPDPGYTVFIDVSTLSGKYTLGLSRIYKGTLESCQQFSLPLFITR